MISKKAQSEVIATVLIILIVLAVIGVVAVVVTKTVKKGAESATEKAACLDIKMTIAEALADADSIKVDRAVGAGAIKSIRVYVNGVLNAENETAIPAELESKTLALNGTTLASENEVKIAAVLSDDTLCDFSDARTVV